LDAISIILIAMVIFLCVFFIKNVIYLVLKIKKKNNCVKELIVILYCIVVAACFSFYIYIGTDFFYIRRAGIYYMLLAGISLIITLFSRIVVWLYVQEKVKYKSIFFVSFMIMSSVFLIMYCHSMFFSGIRMEKFFHENFYLYEDLVKYIKSDSYKSPNTGSNNAKVYYKIVNDEVWRYNEFLDSIIEGRINDRYLEDLLVEIRNKCYVYEVNVYKNRDLRLSCLGGYFNIEYTDDEKVNQIFESSPLFSKLTDRWYQEILSEYMLNTNNLEGSEWNIIRSR